ncbi:hypothetical protein ILUMI_12850 [Ignelater luminosus]|uniref:Uncharacterized protein n=1 Tax=Ignelater luminosus TaxID=2038154 RepID=A0A8K0CXQ3_IGNLU|nr:hypothetical protein ILUMI_12850 [Ignelater luminosus]
MSLVIRRGIRNFAALHSCPKVGKGCNKGAKPKRQACVIGPSGVHPSVEGGYKVWRNISLLICLPLVLLCAYNVATTFKEPPRPKFAKYEYMRKRVKKFPWCGGTDKSFFHNPHLNALPDGYEVSDEEDCGHCDH